MKHVRYCSLGLGSPESALAAVDRRAAGDDPERPRHRQQGQFGSRQSDQLFTAQASTTAPATSTTCSTASATACRCCRPPTPASPRCRAWSTRPSRSPTRCCRRPPAIRPSRRLLRQQPSLATAANLVDGTDIVTGDVLTIAATGGGTATSITFGASESLAQLNTALAANNLTASLDSNNKLVFTTTNDVASSTVGAVALTGTGTATFGAGTAADCRSCLAGHSRQPGQPVQQHHHADYGNLSGFVLQRYQPAEW